MKDIKDRIRRAIFSDDPVEKFQALLLEHPRGRIKVARMLFEMVISDKDRPGVFETDTFPPQSKSKKKHKGFLKDWMEIAKENDIIRVIDLCVDAGCSVDHTAFDQSNGTMLSCAIQCGRIEVVNHLLSLGSSIDAIMKNENEAGDYEQTEPPLITATIHATKTKDPSLVFRLIEMGADIEGVDDYGATSLWHAVLHKNLELADALVECGANPHHLDLAENTMLHDIIANQEELSVEAVQWVIKRGIDVDHRNDCGLSASDTVMDYFTRDQVAKIRDMLEFSRADHQAQILSEAGATVSRPPAPRRF